MSDSPNHILVVEDHEDSAAMLARLLKRDGYQVSIAGCVNDALDVITQKVGTANPVDLIVSDLGLPDGSGYELMEKARQQFHLQGVALSGYGQLSDIQKALDSGFHTHLTKPINFEQLKSVIRDLVEQKRV